LVESQSAQAIRQTYPVGLRDLADGGPFRLMAGQPTGGSELALMLGRSILGVGGYDPEAAARAYGYWFESGPFDIGEATRRALSAIPLQAWMQDRGHERAASAARAAADPDSQANDSLMRVSPLGIWGSNLDPGRLADLARADSQLTHPNLICQEACAV